MKIHKFTLIVGAKPLGHGFGACPWNTYVDISERMGNHHGQNSFEFVRVFVLGGAGHLRRFRLTMSEREAGDSRFGWLGSWAGGAPAVLSVRAGASGFAREGKRHFFYGA